MQSSSTQLVFALRRKFKVTGSRAFKKVFLFSKNLSCYHHIGNPRQMLKWMKQMCLKDIQGQCSLIKVVCKTEWVEFHLGIDDR